MDRKNWLSCNNVLVDLAQAVDRLSVGFAVVQEGVECVRRDQELLRADIRVLQDRVLELGHQKTVLRALQDLSKQ